MIGEARTGSNFGRLHGYLFHGRTGAADAAEAGLQDYLLDAKGGPDRVAWATTRNLYPEDPRYAALMMSATAEQNTRVKKPVYHLMVAAPPGEDLDREQWESLVDRLLGKLGLDEHQALIVAHNDTRHSHVHLMINRVHPEHLKAWSNSFDRLRIERALRHIERDLNLREVPGHHYRLPGQEPPQREGRATNGERQETERTGETSWAGRIRFKIYDDLRSAESWGDLERRLAAHRLRLERRGGGLAITDGEHRVKASRIYRRASYGWLEKRFGMSFEQWRDGKRELLDLVARYQELKRRRAHLLRLRDRAWSSYVRVRDQVDDLDRLRAACRSAASEIDRHLRDLYRKEDLPQVRRLLAADAREHGWEEATRRLAENPRRYGRYRSSSERSSSGRSSRRSWRRRSHGAYYRPPHNTPRGPFARRRYRNLLLQRIKSTAIDLAFLRGARLVAGPAGFRAASAALLARRTWQRAVHRRNGLPPTKTLLKEIAGRAISLGVSGVSLAVAPEPLKLIRTAIRAAQLARALGRGIGR
jgi:hypothetical protein